MRVLCPPMKLEISPPDLSNAVWETAVEMNLNDGLTWTVYDGNTHRTLYIGSDYKISVDGSTATFTHTFPPTKSGETYTITQDVVVT